MGYNKVSSYQRELMMHRLLYPILMTLIPRVLPQVLRYLKLIWKLTFDRRVNVILRALIPLALVYIIWPGRPFDLAPDRLPFGIGKIDDLLVFGGAALLLIKLSPKHVVDEHLGREPISDRPEDQDPSKVVDGSARFVDDK